MKTKLLNKKFDRKNEIQKNRRGENFRFVDGFGLGHHRTEKKETGNGNGNVNANGRATPGVSVFWNDLSYVTSWSSPVFEWQKQNQKAKAEAKTRANFFDFSLLAVNVRTLLCHDP